LTFTLRERLVLVPVDVVHALKPTLVIAVLLFLLGWGVRDAAAGLSAIIAFLGAVAAGTVAAPLLLPWLPGTSFAVKGAVTGVVWSFIWYALSGGGLPLPAAGGVTLALSVVSSFYALNFTGSTPFTSRSGVKKEMRIALPAMAGTLAGAVLLFAWAAFL
jgi:acetyl-CoA decarbonylase/synthase complex subunit gamma